ncbi:MAG: glycerophosphoryl diester phosphodiesterase [Flavobacterium sp.]|jgi:glycerophosphoryl diester phosphodiesterase
MLKIGHRGAKGYVAENTLASFDYAIKLDCDAIELDIQLSKDAIPVVIHDDTTDRTTSVKGKVFDFTFNALSKLGISSLEEILTFVDKKCVVNIEIKNTKATNAVVRIVSDFMKNKNWNNNLFQISSFDFDVLRKVKSLNSEILIGVLTEDSIADALQFAIEIKAYSINPYFKLLNSDVVNSIKKNEFKIFPFTVNLPEDITFVKNLLVDGIISDFPDRI